VKRLLFASVAVLAALTSLTSGCSAGAVPSTRDAARSRPSVPPGGVLILGAGATFPSVLYAKWFSAYQANHPQSVVIYEPVGSSEGIRRFVGRGVVDDERIDFGASDAAMRDDEMASVPAGALLVPLTAGSVALAYNLPDVSADLRLSRPTYIGMFMGEITNWADPRIASTNPGVRLPNLTITTIVRQDGSGTTFAFTKHLDATSDAWRARYGPATLVNWPGNSMRATGNEGVAGRIKQSIGSVGYVGYESARKAGLRVARLENRAGEFVAPSEQSGSSALAGAELPGNMRLFVPDPPGKDSYPIVTLTWILLYKHYADPRKAQLLHDLFRWCLTDGQRFAPELGYSPLPANIAGRAVAALESLRSSGG
jgi:phosphate transport system substrate-binding protein